MYVCMYVCVYICTHTHPDIYTYLSEKLVKDISDDAGHAACSLCELIEKET